ncbi:MAG TPA: hypothetical protein VF666_12960 [Pyrinomonadaceae bacterium]|jgi:hypothetical protein
MSQPEKNINETDNTRRTIFIIVALAAALLVAAIVYLASRPSAPRGEPRLEGAIRPGSPEFEQYRSRLVLEFNPEQNASESTRAVGDIVIAVRPVIRNFTGRTINGLEIHTAVVDLEDKPVKERTIVPIPGRQAELETNKVLEVPFMIEGIKKDTTRANIRMEITGFKFK